MSSHWHPSLKTALNTATVIMMIIPIVTVAPLFKDHIKHCDSDDHFYHYSGTPQWSLQQHPSLKDHLQVALNSSSLRGGPSWGGGGGGHCISPIITIIIIGKSYSAF